MAAAIPYLPGVQSTLRHELEDKADVYGLWNKIFASYFSPDTYSSAMERVVARGTEISAFVLRVDASNVPVILCKCEVPSAVTLENVWGNTVAELREFARDDAKGIRSRSYAVVGAGRRCRFYELTLTGEQRKIGCETLAGTMPIDVLDDAAVVDSIMRNIIDSV